MIGGRTRLVAIVVGLWLTSCAGSAPAAQSAIPTTPPVAGTVTLSLSACTLDTVGAPIRAGNITLTAVNKTDLAVLFDMGRIAEGHTYAELVADIEKARLSAEAGGPVVHRPSYLSGGIAVSLEPGKSGTLTATTSAGTYAIVCLRMYERIGQLRPFAVAGPLQVN